MSNEPLDNPATPDVDLDVPALWPPAGSARDDGDNLVGPDGDVLDPPDNEPGADEDPPAAEQMNPDAGQPLDDVEEGEDIGDVDLNGTDDDDDETAVVGDVGA